MNLFRAISARPMIKGVAMPRLNFDVSDEQMESLKLLQKNAGLQTMKDLINNSLSVFEWAVEETESGNEIASVNEEAEIYRVLATPSLQHVARKFRKHRPAAVAATTR
jgi:hypothetical protein